MPHACTRTSIFFAICVCVRTKKKKKKTPKKIENWHLCISDNIPDQCASVVYSYNVSYFILCIHAHTRATRVTYYCRCKSNSVRSEKWWFEKWQKRYCTSNPNVLPPRDKLVRRAFVLPHPPPRTAVRRLIGYYVLLFHQDLDFLTTPFCGTHARAHRILCYRRTRVVSLNIIVLVFVFGNRLQ